MKILICYFSGTGNTEKVINRYIECFETEGNEVEIRKISGKDLDCQKKSLDFSQYDLLGIAYPVHAFNAPSIMINFVKKIKKQPKKTQLFIIKTSGEPLKLNNFSSSKVKAILRRRNFVLNNEYHYCMPYNMIFRHADSTAYKMWNTANRLIPIDAKEILKGEKVKLKYFPFSSFLAWIMRIEHWGGRWNGKHYKVSDKCLKCQKCVRACPTQNIKFENGEFHFGKNCLMCMRCSFFCPTNAIKIGFFEGWKVNGAYNFDNPNGGEEKHKKYCRKAYKKYFERAEKKIEQNSKEVN